MFTYIYTYTYICIAQHICIWYNNIWLRVFLRLNKNISLTPINWGWTNAELVVWGGRDGSGWVTASGWNDAKQNGDNATKKEVLQTRLWIFTRTNGDVAKFQDIGAFNCHDFFLCGVNYMQEKNKKGSQWFSNSTELHIGFRKKIPSNLNNCTLGIPPEFKHGNGTCNMMIIIPFP